MKIKNKLLVAATISTTAVVGASEAQAAEEADLEKDPKQDWKENSPATDPEPALIEAMPVEEEVVEELANPVDGKAGISAEKPENEISNENHEPADPVGASEDPEAKAGDKAAEPEETGESQATDANPIVDEADNTTEENPESEADSEIDDPKEATSSDGPVEETELVENPTEDKALVDNDVNNDPLKETDKNPVSSVENDNIEYTSEDRLDQTVDAEETPKPAVESALKAETRNDNLTDKRAEEPPTEDPKDDQVDPRETEESEETEPPAETDKTEPTKEEINNKRSEAVTEIKGLDNLIDEKKQEFLGQLDLADTVQKIDDILNQAREWTGETPAETDPEAAQTPAYENVTVSLIPDFQPLINHDNYNRNAFDDEYEISYGYDAENLKTKIYTLDDFLSSNPAQPLSIDLGKLELSNEDDYENLKNNFIFDIKPVNGNKEDLTYLLETSTELLEDKLTLKAIFHQLVNPKMTVSVKDMKNRPMEVPRIPIEINWGGENHVVKADIENSENALAYNEKVQRQHLPSLYYGDIKLEKDAKIDYEGETYTVEKLKIDPVKGTTLDLRPGIKTKEVIADVVTLGIDDKEFDSKSLYSEFLKSKRIINIINDKQFGVIRYISEQDLSDGLQAYNDLKNDNPVHRNKTYSVSVVSPAKLIDDKYHVGLEIQQLYMPRLETNFYDIEGNQIKEPENHDIPIFVKWGDGNENKSKLKTNRGQNGSNEPNGLGLAFKEKLDRIVSPTILYNNKALLDGPENGTIVSYKIRQEDGTEKEVKYRLTAMESDATSGVSLTFVDIEIENLRNQGKEIVYNNIEAGNISQEQAQDLKEKIDKAKSKAEINTILTEIAEDYRETQAAEKALSDIKDQAKTIVESNVQAGNISEEESHSYKSRIDESSDREEINTILTEISDAYRISQAAEKAKYEEELAQAKETAKSIVNNNIKANNLTIEEGAILEERIDKAVNKTEINSILTEIAEAYRETQAVEKAKYEEELAQAKETAKSIVNNNIKANNLTVEEGSILEERIDKAVNKTEINSILTEIAEAYRETQAVEKEKYEEELAQVKITAKSIVDNNIKANNLTVEEGATLKERIDNAVNKTEINSILTEIAEDYRENQAAEKELTEIKDQAKSIVDSNVEAENITAEQGQSFKDRIDNANSKDEINAILSEIAQIYRDKQKSEEVPGEEESPETDELEKLKEQGKAIVDSNVDAKNITSDQGREFKNRIDESENKDKINAILAEIAQIYRENQKAEETPGKEEVPEVDELANLKDQAKTIIDSNVDAENITIEQGQSFKDRIDNANSKDEINAILAEIAQIYRDKQKSEETSGEEVPEVDELVNLKDQAKVIVDTNVEAGNISQEQAQDLKERIDKAKNKAEINTILTEIAEDYRETQAAEKALSEIKNQAKSIVDSNVEAGNISEEEAQAYKDRIDESSDRDEINSILNKIAETYRETQAAEKALSEIKNQAKVIVDTNVEAGNISEEEAQAYKDRIDEASDREEINAILTEIAEDYRENQAAEKELTEIKDQAKSIVDSNVEAENITDEQGRKFKNRIDESENKDEINAILAEIAQIYRDKQKTEETSGEEIPEVDELASLKDQAKAIVDSNVDVKNISEDQGQSFKDRIDNANNKDAINAILAEIAQIYRDNQKVEETPGEETPETNELASLKDQAKAIVDNNVDAKNISSEQGNSFKDRIDNAKSKEEINSILKDIYDIYKENQETSEISFTITEIIPFDIIYVDDDTLPEGVEIIKVVGENGEQIVSYTQKVKDDKKVGEPVRESVTIIKNKVDQVILRGTKIKETDITPSPEKPDEPTTPPVVGPSDPQKPVDPPVIPEKPEVEKPDQSVIPNPTKPTDVIVIPSRPDTEVLDIIKELERNQAEIDKLIGKYLGKTKEDDSSLVVPSKPDNDVADIIKELERNQAEIDKLIGKYLGKTKEEDSNAVIPSKPATDIYDIIKELEQNQAEIDKLIGKYLGKTKEDDSTIVIPSKPGNEILDIIKELERNRDKIDKLIGKYLGQTSKDDSTIVIPSKPDTDIYDIIKELERNQAKIDKLIGKYLGKSKESDSIIVTPSKPSADIYDIIRELEQNQAEIDKLIGEYLGQTREDGKKEVESNADIAQLIRELEKNNKDIKELINKISEKPSNEKIEDPEESDQKDKDSKDSKDKEDEKIHAKKAEKREKNSDDSNKNPGKARVRKLVNRNSDKMPARRKSPKTKVSYGKIGPKRGFPVNPKTGIEPLTGVFATLAAASASMFASKKKKED